MARQHNARLPSRGEIRAAGFLGGAAMAANINDSVDLHDPTAERRTVPIDYNNIVKRMRGSGSNRYCELVAGKTDGGVTQIVKVVVFNLPESAGQ